MTQPDVPVDKSAFYLDLMQQRRDAGQDVPAPEHRFPMLHELGDGILAIPDAFLQLRRDEGYSLGLIQLQTPREALLGQKPCLSGARAVVSVRAGCIARRDGDSPGEGGVSPPLWERYACFSAAQDVRASGG